MPYVIKFSLCWYFGWIAGCHEKPGREHEVSIRHTDSENTLGLLGDRPSSLPWGFASLPSQVTRLVTQSCHRQADEPQDRIVLKNYFPLRKVLQCWWLVLPLPWACSPSIPLPGHLDKPSLLSLPHTPFLHLCSRLGLIWQHSLVWEDAVCICSLWE